MSRVREAAARTGVLQSGDMARHLLVDLENIQPAASAVAEWMGEKGFAWVFYGPHQHKLLASFRALGERVTLIPIAGPGENSLDFHLVFYLGYLAAGHPRSAFTVLAKDTGYDPAIAHARLLTFAVERISTLGSTAADRDGDTKSNASPPPAKAAKKRTETKKTPTKPTAAKKAAPGQGVSAVKAPAPAKKAEKKSAATPAPPTKAAAKGKVSKALAEAAFAAPAKPDCPAVTVVSRTSVAKRSTVVPLIAICRDVLADLRGSHRPRDLPALKRHIQSRIGNDPAAAQVDAVVDHLTTIDAVQLTHGRLVYFPDEPATARAQGRGR